MARKVIFIRGPQGSGKSTLVRRAGLEGFSLSMDRIRDVLGGDMLSPAGQFIPSHENEALAYEILANSLDRRVAGGEVVCLDGTLADGEKFREHWQRFKDAGYKGLVVDLYGFDERLRFERNANRIERERVPEASVQRMRRTARDVPVPEEMRSDPDLIFIHPKTDAEIVRATGTIRNHLRDRRCVRDLSAYDRVVHIGDIQGCHAPLTDPASPVRSGLDPNTFYVFLGDLFDRGVENGAVGRWFMREAHGRPNVALIAGNHEDYVEMQARAGMADLDLPKSEWTRFTWPDLKASGLTDRDCRAISDMAQDYLAYRWRGEEVLCSHAGFAKWPSEMDLVSTHQLRRGNGRYDVEVDAEWSRNEAASGRVQVHGHRNSAMLPTVAAPLSMNLESQVEFGGHLRFVTLDARGFTPTDVRARIHRSMQEDIAVNREVGRKAASRHAPLMPWTERGAALEPVSRALVGKLSNHDMINLRASETLDGVASVNFTHKAFNDAAWDDYTTLARGLYLDTETGTIVARSYEKFFNLGERPETRADTIADRVTYPVEAFEKANGFLCITGYSERHGELVIASKSVTEGTFPEIAKSVIAEQLGEAGMERLLRFNRDQQASLVFEIEDPERDPHIIKVDEPRLVLLACIRRAETFEQAPYKDLQAVAKWIGCEVKARLASLPNARALESFNHRVQADPKWNVGGRPIEGCVMEDADGAFYKLKSSYYRNWKRMRGAVNHVRKAKVAGREPGTERYADMGQPYRDFMEWAKTLSATALEHDIIALRDSFEGDRARMEAIADPVGEDPEALRAEARAAQFSSVIDGIAANDTLAPESVARFIASADEDPVKAEVLRSHDRYEDLLARADDGADESMEP